MALASQRIRLSSLALVIANLAPLLGVLFWGWSAGSVIVLYWFENVVIGVINVARMIALSPADASIAGLVGPARAASLAAGAAAERLLASKSLGSKTLAHGFKLFLVPFFIVHYFMFCAGHGIFVFSMLAGQDGYFPDSVGIDLLGSLGRAIEIFSTPLAFAALALALSHLLSFFVNYLGGGEYRRLDLQRLMMMPYGRIVVLHITIILGGFITLALGEPIWVIVILVVLKIAVDLKMHIREHLDESDGPRAVKGRTDGGRRGRPGSGSSPSRVTHGLRGKTGRH